ncbi:hypothetical protein GCM10023353_38600 [Tomitella cavernea]|uniref:PAS domain-containing protein n=1 Tax=Tomitella cavernea TaxID=1387982 RepID=A0ABP9D6M8_9ACTN
MAVGADIYAALAARSPVPAMIAVYGADRRVWLNQALRALLGYPAAARLRADDIVHPGDQGRQQAVAAALRAGLIDAASTDLRLLSQGGWVLTVTAHDSAARVDGQVTILTLIADWTEAAWNGHY